MAKIPRESAKPGIFVLVIDDDQTMRNAMAGLLKSEVGIQDIITAANGLQGWKALEGKPFDIVLVDWMMPVMDGYNFVKTVRRDAKRHKTKIIMITSKKAVNDVSDAMNVGITSYLIKPFDKDTFARKIQYVLDYSGISPKESEYLDEADKFLVAEDYGKALNCFSKALDVVPAHAEVKLKLASTLMKKFEYDKAYSIFSEMMKGEIPKEILNASSAAMVKLGDIDFAKDMFKESAAKYSEAVTADPSQIEGYVGLGEVDLKLGNMESAKKHFEKADTLLLDIGEDDITMLNNIAIRHRRAGRPKEAARILENSLQRAQGNPYLLYNLGRAYLDLDQMDMAAGCFRDALKIDPGMKDAKRMLMVITGNVG